MFLIGQYDSPFVRRTAIAMRLYGVAFEHRPWSTFGEGDKIAPYNPLRRVPTLVLDVLENERHAVTTPYWFGEHIGHADIAVACVLRFTGEAHPYLFNAARYPALAAHAAHCETLPPFREIVQPLSPPSGD